MSVFVGSLKENKIYPARDYQKSSYDTFMSNKYLVSGKFEYPGNIKFEMFKSPNSPSVCMLKNEYGVEYFLGDNEETLKKHISTMNFARRMQNFGGRYKQSRKSNKRKSIKSKRRAQ